MRVVCSSFKVSIIGRKWKIVLTSNAFFKCKERSIQDQLISAVLKANLWIFYYIFIVLKYTQHFYVPENWFKTVLYRLSTHVPTWVSTSSVRHDAPVSVEPLPQPTVATRATEGAHQPGEAGGPGRPAPA